MKRSERQSSQSVCAVDRCGRRRFFKSGAAMVVAGYAVSNSSSAYAADCDRNRGLEKNAEAPGSDSDAGESADPTGCGRKQEKPKITQYHRQIDSTPSAPVIDRLKG